MKNPRSEIKIPKSRCHNQKNIIMVFVVGDVIVGVVVVVMIVVVVSKISNQNIKIQNMFFDVTS